MVFMMRFRAIVQGIGLMIYHLLIFFVLVRGAVGGLSTYWQAAYYFSNAPATLARNWLVINLVLYMD